MAKPMPPKQFKEWLKFVDLRPGDFVAREKDGILVKVLAYYSLMLSETQMPVG
jgi:hypothetical protein